MSWDQGLFDRSLTTRKFGREVRWFEELDSTNTWLASHASEFVFSGAIAIADHQTSGRGRQSRIWMDRPGTSLLFSLLLRSPIRTDGTGILNLLPAIALASVLEAELDSSVIVSLKWPNDVLLSGRKVAGILGQSTHQARTVVSIIGVGINVATEPDDFPPNLSDKATSIWIQSGRRFDRESLLANLLGAWEPLFDGYLLGQTSGILESWMKYGPKHGTPLIRREGNSTIEGLYEGLGHGGQLLIRDRSGQVHEVFSGDVEV